MLFRITSRKSIGFQATDFDSRGHLLCLRRQGTPTTPSLAIRRRQSGSFCLFALECRPRWIGTNDVQRTTEDEFVVYGATPFHDCCLRYIQVSIAAFLWSHFPFLIFKALRCVFLLRSCQGCRVRRSKYLL